jgi:hypothetical protein
MLTHLFLFAVFLFLPGWLLTRLLAPELTGYLASFAASLALLMANILVFVHFRIPLAVFTPAVVLQITALAACFVLIRDLSLETGKIISGLRSQRVFHLGAVLTVLTTAVYTAWAGVYTEVPADVWRHLGYIQWAYQSFDGSRSMLPVNLWYYVPGWFRYLADEDALTFIETFGRVNTYVQALGIYVFTYRIVNGLNGGPWRGAAVAWLSVLFAAFSIGVDVFSYIRYYAFGPMFQGMLLYFCGILLVLEVFEKQRIRPQAIVLLVVLGGTMLVVHNQEAAFLYAFALAASVVIIARWTVQRLRGSTAVAGPRLDLLAAVALLASTCLFFLYTHFTFPIKGAVLPWIVPASWINPTRIHLYIANPGYQVAGAVTLWGVFVYAVFLANWRSLRHSLFIVAGMLIPLVTVFNPAFVDMFLRHSEASPIYRFIYAVPLHIVAAWCLAACALRVVKRGAPVRKIAAAVQGIALVILLFPTGMPGLNNPDSRLSTLAPVPAGNDYRRWRDMLVFLDTVDATRVITDPVTAYLLRGTTRHKAAGYKFHQARVRLDGGVRYYSLFRGSLIVVNRRDGAPSGNGRRAGHWPEDVLALSRHYPASLEETVDNHPELFELIWERDQIRIYRILPAS